jgi:tripartite-type tricarboxylate transporter receptor subunit TctC
MSIQKSFKTALAAVALFAAATAGAATPAQDPAAFPSRPVRFIVPFTPGSATDALARIIGQKLSEMWGQQVITDNRPGAGSVVGTNIAAKSNPDGYTLLMVSASHAVNATLYPKLPFDPAKDFAGVTQVASIPNVLVVGTHVPAKNLQELIAYARANPGKLNMGSAGIGSASHLNGEAFNGAAGLKMTHIPFKGFAEQLTELYAGRLDLTWAPQILAMSHIKAGRLRPISVSTAKRSTALPDVPTTAEAGLPGFAFDPWFAVLVPAATPKPLVDRLNADIIKVLQMPDVRERLLAQGAEPVWSKPAELDAYVRSEIGKLGKIVRDTGAKPE